MKRYVLALLATIAVGFQSNTRAENEVSIPASIGKPLFGVSANDCDKRINEILHFGPSYSTLPDIRKDSLSDEVLGLKLSDWTNAALDEFYPALFNCQAWRYLGSFTASVQAKLPVYIAQKQKNAMLAEQLNKLDSSAGVSLSCMNGLDYQLPSPGRFKHSDDTTDYSVYQPMNILFGKDFGQYTDADYTFVRQKLATCTTVIDDFPSTTGQPIADSAKLKKLSADMDGWHVIQSRRVQEQTAANAAAEAVNLKVAEAERKKNSPSASEKIGKYISSAGLVGFFLTIAMMPKTDKRYKTGLKGNEKVRRWHIVTFIVSFALIILGNLLS